jgi:hypothetical protein
MTPILHKTVLPDLQRINSESDFESEKTRTYNPLWVKEEERNILSRGFVQQFVLLQCFWEGELKGKRPL